MVLAADSRSHSCCNYYNSDSRSYKVAGKILYRGDDHRRVLRQANRRLLHQQFLRRHWEHGIVDSLDTVLAVDRVVAEPDVQQDTVAEAAVPVPLVYLELVVFPAQEVFHVLEDVHAQAVFPVLVAP